MKSDGILLLGGCRKIAERHMLLKRNILLVWLIELILLLLVMCPFNKHFFNEEKNLATFKEKEEQFVKCKVVARILFLALRSG